MTHFVRHTSFGSDPAVNATQNAENARDVNQHLSRALSGYLHEIKRYAAVGSTSALIDLDARGKRPSAILLAHAQLTNDPGTDIPAVGRCNFYQTGKGLGIYEPSGLSANVLYDLTFLILE